MKSSNKKHVVLESKPVVTRRKAIGLRMRFRILRKYGFRCFYCGKSAQKVELEIDHRVPVSRGGTGDEKNLVAACFKCNRGKADGPSVEAEEREGPCSVRDFVASCTTSGREVPTALYAQFVEWVELSKGQLMTQTAFGRRLTELGYREKKSDGAQGARTNGSSSRETVLPSYHRPAGAANIFEENDR